MSTCSRPEFCPNPDCPYHDRQNAHNLHWFINYGSFPTKTRGIITRFLCSTCGKSCSTQTFSIDYWTHRYVDYRTIDDRLNGCSGYRQIARSLGVSYSLLRNRLLRLARNYLNAFDASFASFPLEEDIAFDGFESFVGSQYTPNNFNIAVGTKSLVPYLCSMTLFRRKGRMTDAQRKRRDRLDRVWRPRSNSLVDQCKESFRDLVSLYLNRGTLTPFTLHTDEKKEYVRALERLTETRHLITIGAMSHRTISSRAARIRSNPLFPVNYLDREIRKNSAAHVRETVRFDREVNMSVSRMAITLGFHAFRKPFRIDNKARIDGQPTHAERAGLLNSVDVRNSLKRLFTHRHVWDQQMVRAKWMEAIWKMTGENPPLFTARGTRARCQPGTGWVARHLVV